MPRQPINYSNSVFYRIVCKDPAITDCYVGCTTNFDKRKHSHKQASTCPGATNHNLYVYDYIRKNGGFENWEMIPIESASFDNAFDARARERYWLEYYGATLNKQLPGNTSDKERENAQKYVEKNNESIACPCGGRYTFRLKSTHFKTQRHMDYVANLEEEEQNMNDNV